MKNTTINLTDVPARAHELLTRSLEAVQTFADQIRAGAEHRAEEVRDAVESTAEKARDAAEPTAEQVTAAVDELIEWAEANRERLAADLVKARSAVETRLAQRAVVTRADLDVLEARLAKVEKAVAAPARKPSAKKAPARKPATTARKPAAKKG